MEIERARADVVVAGAAAGTTVAIALLSGLGVVETGSLATLSPVIVYFAYLFSRKGGPYGVRDTPRNWALGSVLVGIGVVAWALV